MRVLLRSSVGRLVQLRQLRSSGSCSANLAYDILHDTSHILVYSTIVVEVNSSLEESLSIYLVADLKPSNLVSSEQS